MKKSSFRPFIMPLLLIICTLFYYFGELADWAHWNTLRASLFYSVHDINRLLFLAPIIYAGYTARIKGAVIITLVSFIIFLPRAFFISPYPDPLLRMVIFTLGAGVIGYLVARIRNEQERARRLEATMAIQRDKMLRILDSMADGILITGPDYIIRYMNSPMVRDFGEGTGIPCHKYLRNLDAPCQPECPLTDVIENQEIGRWQCRVPDDRNYEVVAVPYVDSDGVMCQLSIFRSIGGGRDIT
jgi:PAS domain-containing protein